MSSSPTAPNGVTGGNAASTSTSATTTKGTRSSHAEALLGPELFDKIKHARILVVGAGGIGCELLKNLVLVGFGNIEIIDLDTIDLSNLNRQFLFRKADIKKSKALVAAAAARHFNPGPSSLSASTSQSNANGNSNGDSYGAGSQRVHIHARHGNIKDRDNDVKWMQGFDLVLGALDNLDARRHVNKLCCAAGVPLIESGTQGYLGQVMPMQKDRTECFDCRVKETPKTYPVCTIRATPSEPIHCIVWAKSYLFGKLFGDDDEAEDENELDKAKADGENADEIEELRKEAHAFQKVRKGLGEEDGAKQAFQKVFYTDINRLLSMEDMWKDLNRKKPKALDYDEIMNETFVPLPVKAKEGQSTNGDGSAVDATAAGAAAPPPADRPIPSQLRDQRQMSVKETLELFIDSCNRLSARAIAHPEIPLAFDKDDEDTMDFVLATANLRSIAYGIPTKTRFEMKKMAGNIIPAIATTNAVIAGFVVMRAINILSNDWSRAKHTWFSSVPRPLRSSEQDPQNPECGVCRDVYVPIECDTTQVTLGTFIGEVVRGWLGWSTDEEGDEREIAVYEDKRLLADPDFDDNYGKTLAELGVDRGKFLTVTDEDDKYMNVVFAISDPTDPSKPLQTPTKVPTIPLRPVKPRVPTPPPMIAGKKRPAPASGTADDDDDVIEIMDVPSAKRVKVDIGEVKGANAPAPAPVNTRKNGKPDDDEDVIIIDDA